eukprot:6212616-Pleurochrysis_carterae.AAC.1
MGNDLTAFHTTSIDLSRSRAILAQVCRCFPGWTGKSCEVEMDRAPSAHKCANDCSGSGKCVHNHCVCDDGRWGVDCSLPMRAHSGKEARRSSNTHNLANRVRLDHAYEIRPPA